MKQILSNSRENAIEFFKKNKQKTKTNFKDHEGKPENNAETIRFCRCLRARMNY